MNLTEALQQVTEGKTVLGVHRDAVYAKMHGSEDFCTSLMKYVHSGSELEAYQAVSGLFDATCRFMLLEAQRANDELEAGL